jgi:hypothetical protein
LGYGAVATALVMALAVWALGGGSAVAEDSHSGSELTGEIFVATSVCDAHRLRTEQQLDPSLQIEIPKEFAGEWPSASACLSHDLAWDEDAPGPQQPIPFSHKHHAGEFGIDCQYCHSGTDRSRTAGVPSVEVCMGCHSQFPKEYDELAGIQILKQHWEEKRPIEWEQIHRLPEYVKFRHNRHVAAGVTCQKCHGPVEKLDKLYLVPDTQWWPWALPTAKLEMGWCIMCHRENDQQASQDCLMCHY